MPFYNFEQDLKVARETELDVAELLEQVYGAKLLGFNNNSDYDIIVLQDGLPYTYEVKEDFSCERTGNVGLEYSCRGRPSGISVTRADWYVYKIHSAEDGIVFIRITPATLTEMIADKLYHRIVNGGDAGSNSLNYLFSYSVFKSKGELIENTRSNS